MYWYNNSDWTHHTRNSIIMYNYAHLIMLTLYMQCMFWWIWATTCIHPNTLWYTPVPYGLPWVTMGILRGGGTGVLEGIFCFSCASIPTCWCSSSFASLPPSNSTCCLSHSISSLILFSAKAAMSFCLWPSTDVLIGSQVHVPPSSLLPPATSVSCSSCLDFSFSVLQVHGGQELLF